MGRGLPPCCRLSGKYRPAALSPSCAASRSFAHPAELLLLLLPRAASCWASVPLPHRLRAVADTDADDRGSRRHQQQHQRATAPYLHSAATEACWCCVKGDVLSTHGAGARHWGLGAHTRTHKQSATKVRSALASPAVATNAIASSHPNDRIHWGRAIAGGLGKWIEAGWHHLQLRRMHGHRLVLPNRLNWPPIPTHQIRAASNAVLPPFAAAITIHSSIATHHRSSSPHPYHPHQNRRPK